MKSTCLVIIFLSIRIAVAKSQPLLIKNEVAVVLKGLPEMPSSHRIDKYFAACKLAGDYYFSKREYKKAIWYYDKVATMNLDGHGDFDLTPLSPKAFEIYKQIRSRVGDMYLNGQGARSNFAYAAYYYSRLPSPFHKKEIDGFSQKLFGNTTIVYFDLQKSSDSVSLFYINPLYIWDAAANPIPGDFLQALQLKMLGDTSLHCLITMFVVTPTEPAQSASHRFIERILDQFPGELRQRFNYDLDFSEDVLFRKNSVKFYVLKIKIQR